MRIFNSNKVSRVIILVLLFATFVFPYKKVKVFVLNPPEVLLKNIKQVAVLNFDGEYGNVFADRFITQLLKDDRGCAKQS